MNGKYFIYPRKFLSINQYRKYFFFPVTSNYFKRRNGALVLDLNSFLGMMTWLSSTNQHRERFCRLRYDCKSKFFVALWSASRHWLYLKATKNKCFVVLKLNEEIRILSCYRFDWNRGTLLSLRLQNHVSVALDQI